MRCAFCQQLVPVAPNLPAVPDANPQAAAVAVAAAIDAECADDKLTPLTVTVKRQHVHYTHVRTHNADHVQPHQLSREGFAASFSRRFVAHLAGRGWLVWRLSW